MLYKFNPFTGTFDVVMPDNFSYDYILIDHVLCIPQYQQMAVHGRITNDGTIVNDGTLVVV